MMKIIAMFKISVITKENIEVLHLVSVTQDTKHQKKFLWCQQWNKLVELVEEFKEQFECLGENPEKYITLIEKDNENSKT